jgi:hypothetical protein
MRAMILAAMSTEARAIARAFHWPKPWMDDAPGDGRVAVEVVGVGARHLDRVAARKPEALIMAGLAGALHPGLEVGAVVIDGSCKPPAGARLGKVWTTGKILAAPAEKALLYRQTGALAADMETEPARRFAEALGIPFLAVRAISDTAAQWLNPALLDLVDGEGRPRLGRVLCHIMGGPGRLTELLRIRRAGQTALASLTAALVALIDSGWPVGL